MFPAYGRVMGDENISSFAECYFSFCVHGGLVCFACGA